MFRRLMVVVVFGAAGVGVFAPASASANQLCEYDAYVGPAGVSTSTGTQCVPNWPLGTACSSGTVLLGPAGYIYNNNCLPAN